MSPGNDELKQDDEKRQEPGGGETIIRDDPDNPLPGETIPPSGERHQQRHEPDDRNEEQPSGSNYQNDDPQAPDGKAVVHPDGDGAKESADEMAGASRR